MSQSPLLNPIKDVHPRLGISRATLWKLIAEGKIPTVRIGRRTLIAESALQEFVSNAAISTVKKAA